MKNKIKPLYTLKMKDDLMYDLTEKFEQYAFERYDIKVQEETEFKEMTGALGNFFIGERMFKVVV